MDMNHLKFLQEVANQDVSELNRKEKTYKGSWKRRGGVGASMMALRKVDRLEQMLCECSYDIFELISKEGLEGADGTAIAEIRDLRRYLLLIEAEMISRVSLNDQPSDSKLFPGVGLKEHYEYHYRPDTPEDGGHHASREDNIKVLERLEDGLQTSDIEPCQRRLYMSTTYQGKGYNIVNRDKVDSIMWEHLPRLSTELNNKEYEESLPEYKALYTWQPNGNKWSMQERYRANWGPESKYDVLYSTVGQ